MRASLADVVKALSPPIMLRLFRKIETTRYGFHGDYACWADALSDADGYDTDIILTRVREALLEVQQGHAAYERDGVLFKTPTLNWPLMACLMRIASKRRNRLHVLDFGGSLGSVYFQHRHFLGALDRLRWSVVEQNHFVACGKQHFEDDRLRFFTDMDACAATAPVDMVLLSSVLPYLENPYDLITQCHALQAPYVVVDRTPFLLSGQRDRLTVQQVPPVIYPASYPAWFFNEEKWLAFLQDRYRVITTFPGSDRANIPSQYKGYMLERL